MGFTAAQSVGFTASGLCTEANSAELVASLWGRAARDTDLEALGIMGCGNKNH